MESRNDTEEYEVADGVEEIEGDEGSSRRSFMKKGAVAAGALALGGAASSGTAAAQVGEEFLIFTDEYFPRATFRVVARIPATTTINILRNPRVPEISQPDEYTGWVIRYRLAGGSRAGGITSMVFSRNGNLPIDGTGRFGADAQVFSARLNLLSVTRVA